MIDLKKFGEDFIKQSRDTTLDKYDMIAAGKMKSEEAKRIYSLLKSFDKEQLEKIKSIVINMVDRTIFNTLFLFEESEHWAIVNKSDSNSNNIENAADVSDGLTGELFSNEGWIANYSEYKLK